MTFPLYSRESFVRIKLYVQEDHYRLLPASPLKRRNHKLELFKSLFDYDLKYFWRRWCDFGIRILRRFNK